MKLTRVAIDDREYNALQKFDQKFLYLEDKKNVIEPICLVGENGAGKSNLLELISELFFRIEYDLRRIQRTLNNEKSVKPKYKVERKILIEYKLFDEKGDEYAEVRIDSYSKEWRLSKLIDNEFIPISKENLSELRRLMPDQVVSYSSGENESLSYWFTELDKEYSDEIQKSADIRREEKSTNPRMIYLNYDTTSAIVIANYMYNGAENLNVFKDTLRIEGVKSFRIYLNFKYKSGYVRLSEEHIEIIEKFKKCSTIHNIETKEVNYNQLKRKIDQPTLCSFDFYVDELTVQRFRDEFDSAQDLYMAFRKFELLNSLKLSGSHRKSSLNKNVLHRPPTVGHEDRIFRIDDIILKINNPNISIPYIGISDGQHQFLQTIGTILLFENKNVLFLLDEPETHFNPQWRSQFVYNLHRETLDRYQEIILTTHSPYVVSDCEQYNVFVFKREGENVTFDNIDIQTYGTSFDNLLKRTFNVKHTISQKAYNEIQKLMKSDNSEYIQERLDNMGPSFEKLPLLKRLKDLEPKS